MKIEYILATQELQRIFPLEFYLESLNAKLEYLPVKPAVIMYEMINKQEPGLAKASMDQIKTQNQLDLRAQIDTLVSSTIAQPPLVMDALDGKLPLLNLIPVYNRKKFDQDSEGVSKEQPTGLLMVQYFKEDQTPLFTNEISYKELRDVPELLYDDPNLLIAILQIDTMEIGLIKAPEYVIGKLSESVDQDEKD